MQGLTKYARRLLVEQSLIDIVDAVGLKVSTPALDEVRRWVKANAEGRVFDSTDVIPGVTRIARIPDRRPVSPLTLRTPCWRRIFRKAAHA